MPLGYDEGDELVESLVVAEHDGGLGDAVLLDELRLDLAEFDPEAADLDLVIDPPTEMDTVLCASSITASPERYSTGSSPSWRNGFGTNFSRVSTSRLR